MTSSIFARAQRIVDLGKAAMPGPWTAEMVGLDMHWSIKAKEYAGFGHICDFVKTKTDTKFGGALSASMNKRTEQTAEFIAAARDADQIAQRLIEAEGEIRRLLQIYRATDCNCAHGMDIERSEEFLATLHKEAP